HNGNITNATELRAELEREGSIFQASSDTEVILHLVARSRERTLAGALREAMLQLEGAFSLVFLASDRIIVARDPHGFRPLAMGQMELPGGDRKSTRLNSSHQIISYAVFCLKKKTSIHTRFNTLTVNDKTRSQ